MATSSELELFLQIAHILEEMLEGETGVGRLALPFARLSTRRFREGDCDGGFESFSYAKSMFVFSQNDPVYAQDFFDHLVEEGALEREIRDIEPCEDVEKYVTNKGDKEKEGIIEERKHGEFE